MRAHNTAAGIEAIILAGCWAHARRGFIEARETTPRTCAWLLRQIGALYQIERKLRTDKAGPRLREAVRAAQSKPILHRIRAAMERIRPRHLPQSAMARAITYTLDQWPSLQRFASDGRIEIDNNGVENAIRPTAIGKKNWLFVGAADAGDRGAILYTIVEPKRSGDSLPQAARRASEARQSCRRRGIDPQAYLRDILTRLPKLTTSQIPDITPEAYAKATRQREHLPLAS